MLFAGIFFSFSKIRQSLVKQVHRGSGGEVTEAAYRGTLFFSIQYLTSMMLPGWRVHWRWGLQQSAGWVEERHAVSGTAGREQSLNHRTVMQ